MRTLTDHKLNGLNDSIFIGVGDNPGAGGANHHYLLTLPDWTRNPDGSNPHHVWNIDFQEGPINEAGINGISNEALIAVVIDRLRGFQYQRTFKGGTNEPTVEVGFNFNSRGEFACRENAEALTLLETALMWLHKRTRDRLARGVEGTSNV